jgi:hypothetical protein
MRSFLIAAWIVRGFLAIAGFADSQAADQRGHVRMAAEARCLDTHTAALPEVQQMCIDRAAREVP